MADGGQLSRGLPEDVGLTRHRKVWGFVGGVPFFSSGFLYFNLVDKLVETGWIEDTGDGPCGPLLALIFLCHNFYMIFVFVITLYIRLPVPYKLEPSEKEFVDYALVVACSCWTAFVGEEVWTTVVIGYVHAFHFVAFLNLWWDYQNFGFWDCACLVLVEAVLFCCRGRSLLVLMAVAGGCIALQRKKNAYQQILSQKKDE